MSAAHTANVHYRARGHAVQWSLRARVQLLTASLAAVAVSATAIAVYVVLATGLSNRVDDQLESRATAVIATATDGRSYITPNALLTFPADRDAATGLVTTSGILVASTPNNAPFTGDDHRLDAAMQRVVSGDVGSAIETVGDYRILGVRTDTGETVLVAQSLATMGILLQRVAAVLAVVGGFGVLFAAVVGAAAARTGLRPVGRLTAATRKIGDQGDLTPIEVTGDDELAKLASSFNVMLAALAVSRDRQRQLIMTAGEALEGPLNEIRTNIDQLIAPSGRTLSMAERDAVQVAVISEMEALSRIIGDVVDKARDEHKAR